MNSEGWHSAVVVKLKDGNFQIFSDLVSAQRFQQSNPELFPSPIEYDDVHFNFNKGQPLVKFRDHTMSIVDVDSDRSGLEGVIK